MAFVQVNQFVDNDVFEAVGWFLGKFKVEPDATGLDVTGAPAGLHLFDAPRRGFDAEDRLPLGQQGRDLRFELAAIPFGQHPLTLGAIAAGAYIEVEIAFVADHHLGRAGLVDHIQPVAVAPVVMTFTGDHLAWRLAFLAGKFEPLLFDPGQLGNGKEPNRLIADPLGRSNAHPAIGRIDAQVQILDRFAHNVDDKVGYGDLVHSCYVT